MHPWRYYPCERFPGCRHLILVQRLAVEGQDFDEAFSPEESTPGNSAVLREELLDWLKYTIPLTLSERATSAFVARHGDHDTLICGGCWKFNTPRLMFTQAEVKKELVDIFGLLEWFEKFVMQMSIEDLNQALWNVQYVRRAIPWLAKISSGSSCSRC